ncbi:Tfp pilus assembly protein PilN [Alkalibacillus flavidus]|uniref:Tfp pilus assembly protein PilN n=1 Tax=Alkalibacillus flavidus TaxID=546021 RepID=A0ABV2KU64_9BACI
MLADINLLPKKEKKNRSGLYTTIIMTVITLLVAGGLGYWMWLLQGEEASLEQDMQQQRQQNAALQSEIEGDATEQEAEQLEQVVTRVREAIIEMQPIMQNIAGNVPADGQLIALAEQEDVIEITVETSSNTDAVAFYQDLEEVERFPRVMIRTIDYIESEEHYLTTITVNLQAEEEGNDDEAE